MNKAVSIAAGIFLSASVFANGIPHNAVYLDNMMSSESKETLRFKLRDGDYLNHASCAKDGFITVWYGEPCKYCNTVHDIAKYIMHKQILVDALMSALVEGTPVRPVVDGCGPESVDNVVDVLYHRPE